MTGRIVVGVDGSPQSRTAYEFALEEARRRDAALAVVCAWQLPVKTITPLYGSPLNTSRDDVEQEAMAVLDKLIGTPPEDVDVTPIAAVGPPAETLLDAGRDADLLIVGSRGLGGFSGLLQGSTSQHVVRHATCPVTVVPTRRTAAGGAPDGDDG